MGSTTIQYFEYAHLPEQLQEVSRPICELAHLMEDMLPDGPEKSAGMRKLLEAKDCFVRANLITKESAAKPPTPHVGGHVKHKWKPDWGVGVVEENIGFITNQFDFLDSSGEGSYKDGITYRVTWENKDGEPGEYWYTLEENLIVVD